MSSASVDQESRLERLQRLRLLRQYQWACDREGCDGHPHEGWPDRHARASQLPPPGDWLLWFLLGGRGAGKTRTGAESAKALAGLCELPNLPSLPGSLGAIVAPTFADCRDTCVEGESGLLSVLPPDVRKATKWNRSMGELMLPNGTEIKCFSADEPDRLRGPQHHWAWCDEPASWDKGFDVWDMLLLGLRLGPEPKVVMSGTPKPVVLLRGDERKNRVGLLGMAGVVVTRSSTYDNLDNLAPTFRAQVVERYEGTRLGRQELHAEVLEDVEGALWSQALIEQCRWTDDLPALGRVVVGVDPPGGATECGIVVAGLHYGPCPCGGGSLHGFVLDDLSLSGPPNEWGNRAVGAYREHRADRIVAERNFGADMVTHVIETVDPNASLKTVVASRGKQQRAEPVLALYEQGKVHHVGVFASLEREQTEWVPGETSWSPNRVDALVWALHELMLGETGPAEVQVPGGRSPSVRPSVRAAKTRVGTGGRR